MLFNILAARIEGGRSLAGGSGLPESLSWGVTAGRGEGSLMLRPHERSSWGRTVECCLKYWPHALKKDAGWAAWTVTVRSSAGGARRGGGRERICADPMSAARGAVQEDAV